MTSTGYPPAGPAPGAARAGTAADAAELVELVRAGGVLVLSGAGLSTESGIPDYRGPSGAARRHTPMTYQTFTGDPAARRRYWARSHLGWRSITTAVPNAGHRAVTELARRGLLTGVLTQNVDGLHQAAGAATVLELHGSLARVTCLTCGALMERAELARRLDEANPGFTAAATVVNPDGDAEVAPVDLDRFVPVACGICGGLLKPDVVFFGEPVPAERVARGYALVDRARAVLVLGSSLAVHSGRRFVTRAARAGVPVAIVNQGATRGDPYARIRLDAPLGPALSALVAAL